jgi:hypothetical protein
MDAKEIKLKGIVRQVEAKRRIINKVNNKTRSEGILKAKTYCLKVMI